MTSTSRFATFRLIAADIKLAHSVFAMPFAILAAVMAAAPVLFSYHGWGYWLPEGDPGRIPPTPMQIAMRAELPTKLVLIVLAMIFARTVAMLANRLLDRHIDKLNPRTATRAIPSGGLSPRPALLVTLLCVMAFINVCACFGWFYQNWLPLRLSPFVLVWISVYALFKRFTWLCHLWLGASLAISPIAAAIAIEPYAIRSQTSLWVLSCMVLCWVAGFDIIYALQDVDIDRQQNLYSIPSRLGIRNAMWFSRFLHAIAAACLVATLVIDSRFGILFTFGVIIVIALLIYEHLTVARWGTTRIALAFFTLNGIISCVLGALGVIDVLYL